MRDSVAVKHSAEPQGKSGADDVVRNFIKSIDSAKRADQPYRNWSLTACLPADTVDDILGAPFEAPSLEGVSGKRELHNNTRKYFDVDNRKQLPGLRGGGASLPGQARHQSHREGVRHQSRRHLSPHRVRPGHRRLLGSSRTPTLASRCSPCCSICRRTRATTISAPTSTTPDKSTRRPLALRAQCGDDLRARG